MGTGVQHVEMPAGSKLLTVKLQGPSPAIWAFCDDKERPVERRLCAFATGDEIDVAGQYIATVQLGGSVVHYFDLGEIEKPATRSELGPTH